jgi:DNA-binding NtrC family response regulator
MILKALETVSGNKSQAARLLGITRRALYSKMETHGIPLSWKKEAEG